ncbi:MAG: 23S rRNA pseudouridine(1911/1915/1917) synthase RluD [Pseudomonadales bacterium]|jgi:23S rRNA pseudouridine1911/1915/1917 synthase
MSSRIQHKGIVPGELSLERFDQVAAILFPQYSRSRLQSWIKSKELLVGGKPGRSKDKVSAGDIIEIDAVAETLEDEGEDIPLDIIHEDESIIVVNKPVGLVVHPGAGNRQGTLLNALLFHHPDLAEVPRAGIVHRLDKETSGLMVVAKTITSQTSLVEQLQSRKVRRIYHAIVYGIPRRNGTIEAAIERHPTHRTKMAVRFDGKEAITHHNLIEAFDAHAHMEFALETGRTHQIRVHMQHLGFPIVGDPVYGGTFRKPAGDREQLAACLRNFSRQALHAKELQFRHPESGNSIGFEIDLPADIAELLVQLKMAKLKTSKSDGH